MATTPAIWKDEEGRDRLVGLLETTDAIGLPTGWTEDASDPANVDGGAGSLQFEDGTVTTLFTGDGLDSQDSGTSARVLAQAGSGVFSAPPAAVPAFNADDAGGATVALDGGGLAVTNIGNAELGLTGASTLGFYGHAATAQQTGVAVTAAGIHAALVALGLITA